MKHIKKIGIKIIVALLIVLAFSCENNKFEPNTTEVERFSIGGDNATPLTCEKITFDLLETGSVDLQELKNVATKGGYLWKVAENRSNRSVEMSVKANQGAVKSWLVVKVDFDNANTFSFTSRDGFNNGNPLKVLYSTDDVENKSLTELSWTDITSTFNIASSAPKDAMSDISIPSGDWDLSNVTGNGIVAFVYEGAVNGISTVMQIDNITVLKSGCSILSSSCLANLPSTSLPFEVDFEGEDNPFSIITEKGLREWSVFGDDDNKFMQVSSFESGEANKTWLISPTIDFELYNNESLTFDSKDGFYNGQPLTVLYSSDYDGSSCPSDATWETLNAIIASGSTDDLATDFTSSGSVDLTALMGQGNIAFVYGGAAGGVTTDIQIDNIVVYGESCVNNGVDETKLVNPGFDDWCSMNQPKGWDTIDSGIEVTQDEQIFREGTSSMKVVVSDTDKQDIYQRIPVEAGKFYKISFWVYHTDNQIRARVVVPGWPSLYSDPNIINNWQKVEYVYESNTTEVLSLAGMRFYKSGTWTGPTSTTYIDDFNFEEVQEPNLPVLRNGSFENWSGGVLENWKTTDGADFTFEEETTLVTEGEKSLKITTGSIDKLDIFQEGITLEVGKTYTWSMDVYLTDPNVRPRLVPGIIWGAYVDTSILNQWQTVVNTVTVQDAGSGQGNIDYHVNNGEKTRFRIYFSGSTVPNPASVIYIDNFRLIED